MPHLQRSPPPCSFYFVPHPARGGEAAWFSASGAARERAAAGGDEPGGLDLRGHVKEDARVRPGVWRLVCFEESCPDPPRQPFPCIWIQHGMDGPLDGRASSRGVGACPLPPPQHPPAPTAPLCEPKMRGVGGFFFPCSHGKRMFRSERKRDRCFLRSAGSKQPFKITRATQVPGKTAKPKRCEQIISLSVQGLLCSSELACRTGCS